VALLDLLFVLGRLRARRPQRDVILQQFIEFLSPDGFRKISIHSRREETFAVAFHSVRGKGDDWSVKPRLFFTLWQLTGGFESIHFGHLHIHQDQIVSSLFEGARSLASVGNNLDGVPTLLEETCHEPLVHCVVLSDQDAERSLAFWALAIE
jgi:hypothetical protein